MFLQFDEQQSEFCTHVVPVVKQLPELPPPLPPDELETFKL
jgi:hypothetical protein